MALTVQYQMGSSELLTVADVEWLRAMWEYSGRKVEFDMRSCDWENYSALLDLLKANANLVEAFPNNDVRDEKGQPAITFVRIKPDGLKLLKEKLREVHRQITVDGKKVDLRSGWNHLILTCDIENLELLASNWLRQLKAEKEPRVWRAVQMNLMKLLAYRGRELSSELKDRISNLPSSFTYDANGDAP
jgi:hypothetical protein